MNEYEVLYGIKQDIEKKISENKLFKLSVEDAVLTVLEKVGVFFKIYNSALPKKKQKHLKSIVKTNALEIDELLFFQESVKWIFRWCTQYCSKYSQLNKKEVVADDIFDLMGKAYAYENFFIMWDLHRAKIVKYNKIGNQIIFDYINESVYKVHVVYDTIFRHYNNLKQIDELNLININPKNAEEIFTKVHQTDFNCSFNIEFAGFNLEEYNIFSTSLNNIIVQASLANINNNINLIIPGQAGVFNFKKEEWIKKLSAKTEISHDKIESMIDFFTYDFLPSSDISLAYFVPCSNNYLVLSEAIFMLSRPEVNAIRLLAKKKSTNFDRAQNNYEDEEKSKIIRNLGSRYLMTDILDKTKKYRPGMDFLVYDKENNHLQIIELKYKIPIESTWDIKRLDDMLDKGYTQINDAMIYTTNNKSSILSEYFGEIYKGVSPEKIDFFILTNYSIGTGTNVSLPTPVLLRDHYIELMKNSDGMNLVRYALNVFGK